MTPGRPAAHGHRLAAVGALLLWAAGGALAGSGHKVAQGETFASIARDEFGDADLALLIALHNDLDPASRPQPGRTLHFPAARVVRLMIPQRYDSLAFRHLGDEALTGVLAAINGHLPEEPVQFRDWVVLPAIVEYRRKPGESLAEVARRVYGPGHPAWALEMANPDAGRVVRIPVIDFFRESLGSEEKAIVEAARARLRKQAPPGSRAAPSATVATGEGAARPEPPAREAAGSSEAPATEAPATRVAAAPAQEAPARPPARVEPSTPPARARTTAPPPSRSQPASRPQPPVREPAAPSPPPAGERRGPVAVPPPQGDGVRTPEEVPADAVPSPVETAAAPVEARVDLASSRAALPDPIPWAPLEEARRRYEVGEYHRAQLSVSRMLDAGSVPPEQEVHAWLLLGLCRLAREEPGAAEDAFRRARGLDPLLDLDPFFYPPKVRDAFRRAAPAS